MSGRSKEIRRVLAIDPMSRGFGFAVLEGPENLIDYGTRGCAPGAPEVCLKRVTELLDVFHLDLMVLEDVNAKGSRRSERVRKLLREIEALARSRGVPTRRVARNHAKAALYAKSKHQLATVIAQRFPQLGMRLPPPPKAWTKVPYRMAIFTAVAFGIAVFGREGAETMKHRLS